MKAVAVHLPSFPSIGEALDWLHLQGEVLRVCLLRGSDGLVRGSALIRPFDDQRAQPGELPQ